MSSSVVQPPMSDDGDDEGPDEDLPGDHAWHYRYNRRLSCFSQSVGTLAFTQDGQWLVSATKSGHLKIFDTEYWAERAKLPGRAHEEPRAIAVSPAQRWLVCMFTSVMHIFECKPPWRLEQRVVSPLDPRTAAPSEFVCCSFSPMSEVDHPGGHTGQDNHLAAFTSRTLIVLDYSGGWHDTPKRTACIMSEERPTSIAYTACGWWLVCGYESGHLQIWNHFSLTLERTLFGHESTVSCITSTPRAAQYDPRFISCGLDCSLRVWHSNGWLLEQVAPDTRADRNGIRSCMFSRSGDWVVSVAVEMCVWRVCISKKGRLELRLHQRLTAVCGAEGLCTAAVCSKHDAIAVGSRDGVLGLWTKLQGWPSEHGNLNDINTVGKTQLGGTTPWKMPATPLARPMMNVRPEGSRTVTALESIIQPFQERRSLRSSEWFVRTDLRTVSSRGLHLPSAVPNRRPRGERSQHASMVKPGQLKQELRRNASCPTKLPNPNMQKVSAYGMESNTTQGAEEETMPSRWRSTSFDCEDVLAPLCSGPKATTVKQMDMESPLQRVLGVHSKKNTNNARSLSNALLRNRNSDGRELPPLAGNGHASAKAAIEHLSNKGLVQRISLAPQQIC